MLIKLADRLHNMRTLAALPPSKQRKIAQETLEIFAPLANRLGIWQMKWELEDLALQYSDPDKYQEITDLIAERRGSRERHITAIIDTLKARLAEEGIKVEITGRPKHIYSIYQKMKAKERSFDEIYDVQGVRIIVDEVKDCYAALGIVHTLWRPIPGEFDDYIAMPKDNMYRSLHTAVVGSQGKPLEIQIRTWEMHQTAELGIAAHWRYKEQVGRDTSLEAKIAWLRGLMEWQQELADAQEFVDSLKTDLFPKQVYVLTPKGDIIDLPGGATPIDFAYRIHTEIGERCRGAKVNGKLVPLNYRLQSGDQVEILTTKKGGPSRDWLNPHLGYVVTSRAKQKIRQWFRRQEREESIAQGREILEKELKRLGIGEGFEDVARLFRFKRVEDLFAVIGYGDINVQQIATRLVEKEEGEPGLPTVAPPTPPISDITVLGVGDLLTRVARCCHPLPGDKVVGYVTRGQGVTIHRQDCGNILRRTDKERLIEVEWGTDRKQVYPVMIKVVAFDRKGLLKDIATIVEAEDVNMAAANVTTSKKDHMAVITATLEIANMAQLSR
ncbi:MAG: RelA/SpoT family protein, partial [Anaerolineae bacterium]